MSPIITPGGSGGGGSQPQTLTVDVTTDPNTFLATWEHDFGKVTPLFVAITMVAFNGNGETFGAGLGDIALGGITPNYGSFQGQRDDLPNVPGWTNLPGAFAVFNANVNDGFSSLAHYAGFAFLSPQCIRFLPSAVGIYDQGGAGPLYAGANHPTVTFRLTVEYI